MNDFRLKILLTRGLSRLPALLLGSGDFVERALPVETPVSDVDPEDSGPSRLDREGGLWSSEEGSGGLSFL